MIQELINFIRYLDFLEEWVRLLGEMMLAAVEDDDREVQGREHRSEPD